jgi:4-alpha-glucanotransferase
MSRPPSALRALAERAGILSSYTEQTGREERTTSDDTRAALLAAMGLDAADERQARRTLDEWEERAQEEMMPPARVVRGPGNASHIVVRVPGGRRGELGWNLSQQMPGGEDTERAGRSSPDEDGMLRLRLPIVPEPGYHRIRVRLHYEGHHPLAEQTLIVAPRTCPPPQERLNGRVFGLAANLYAIRSERNWGAGDLGDLATLVRWMAVHGAAFVGVNPLHALRNTGGDVSPYRPVSRIFRNPLYLELEAVPEFKESRPARDLASSPETRGALAELRASRWVNYDRVWGLKSRVLEALYATFREQHLGRNTERGRAFREFVRRQGHALDEHATFLALEEWLRTQGHTGSWQGWPAEYRDPKSAKVAEWRRAAEEQVDRHRWLQFELDRQVAAVADVARESGMRVGLYQDLAIGCSPDGSDAWANQNLLLSGVSLGAPPDQYSDSGQNWGLPPMNPHTLARKRYEYWISLIRAALDHAGALRIDHVLGLFRQFWIPDGKSGAEGAYVRFPRDELLGILALEATRAGALIVGEDLGTVPPEVPPTLRDWQILGTKVMYFEQDRETGFAPASSYDELALTVADTHDMVPLAGYWEGRDIGIRAATGLIAPEAEEQARAERARERESLKTRLRTEGVLGKGEAPDANSIARAVHAFLCATPSLMVALSLDDVAGEAEPVNVPGVSQDAFPSWTRRLAMPLDALMEDEEVNARITACDRRTDA